MLNFPKTGSSFTRAVVKAIYRRRRWRWGTDRFLKELMLPKIDRPGRVVDQHGTWVQIPEEYRHLSVAATIRNPFDRALSMYRFRWWVERPPVPREMILAVLPHFPDLSFSDYLTLCDIDVARRLGGANPAGMGKQTHDFVRFFFRDPPRALQAMSDDYVDSGAYRADLADVALLCQERLREDLAGWLAGHGFTDRELEICRRHPRINETPATGSAAPETQALDRIASSDRFVLRILADLGFDYRRPSAAGSSPRAH